MLKLLFLLIMMPSLLFCSNFAEYIHYNPEGENPIGYLSLDRERSIDQSSVLYFKYAIEEFKALKVPFVLLRLNTPGGEVHSALKIAKMLQDLDSQDHIPVVALIDNWAISAGAMLAYSCRYIVATESASMGAAEAVLVGEGGKMEAASEKIQSVIRSEMANLARFYGRDPQLAEAMVDRDLTLDIKPKGKLLTLNAEQLIQLGVADLLLTTRGGGAEKLLFTAPFFDKIPQPKLISYHSWKIDFFSFLLHPMIASLLLMGLIVGIYMEMNHPGFGVFGILALMCLGLILLSSFAVQAASFLELIILVIGLGLLLLEIFFFPGFGIAGIAGVLLVLFSVLAMLAQFPIAWDAASWSIGLAHFLYRMLFLASALVLSFIAIALLARFVSFKLPWMRRLVLVSEHTEEVVDLPPLKSQARAFTSMRPSGKVIIGEKIYDAISESGFIEKDCCVIIYRYEGSKMIVRKCL